MRAFRLFRIFLLYFLITLFSISIASAGLCGFTQPTLSVELNDSGNQLLPNTDYLFVVYSVNYLEDARDQDITFEASSGTINGVIDYSFDSSSVTSNRVTFRKNGVVRAGESNIGYVKFKTPPSGNFILTVSGNEVEDGFLTTCNVAAPSINKEYTVISTRLDDKEYFARLAEQRAEILSKYKAMYLKLIREPGGNWDKFSSQKLMEAFVLSLKFSYEVGQSVDIDPTSAKDVAQGWQDILNGEPAFISEPLATFKSFLDVGTGLLNALIINIDRSNYKIPLVNTPMLDQSLDTAINLYNQEAIAWRNGDKSSLKNILEQEDRTLWPVTETTVVYQNVAQNRDEVAYALFYSLSEFSDKDITNIRTFLTNSVDKVFPTYGVDIKIDGSDASSTKQIVAPNSAVYGISIVNTGNKQETITLSTTSASGWTASPGATSLTLNSGETRNVDLTVTNNYATTGTSANIIVKATVQGQAIEDSVTATANSVSADIKKDNNVINNYKQLNANNGLAALIHLSSPGATGIDRIEIYGYKDGSGGVNLQIFDDIAPDGTLTNLRGTFTGIQLPSSPGWVVQSLGRGVPTNDGDFYVLVSYPNTISNGYIGFDTSSGGDSWEALASTGKVVSPITGNWMIRAHASTPTSYNTLFSLSTIPNPVDFGDSVTLNADVYSQHPMGSYVYSGTVTFSATGGTFSNGLSSITAPIPNNYRATTVWTPPSNGTYTIYAAYSGGTYATTTYLANSTSKIITVNPVARATTLTLTSNDSIPSNFPTQVKIKVTDSVGNPVPSGKITLSSTGGTLQDPVVYLNNGNSSTYFSALNTGTYTINANFEGSIKNGYNYQPSSGSKAVIVYAAPDLSISYENISFNPSTPATGENVTISAEISNIGTAPGTATNVSFYHDSISEANLTGRKEISNLAVGEKTRIQTNWSTVGYQGDHLIIVEIKNSEEKNTGNNIEGKNIHISRTITVDDSGGADYTRIQDAINNASAGDTIEVRSGTYYENVDVNKPLVLRGVDNGGGKPVVDGKRNGNTITLNVDGNVLENFSVANSGTGWYDAGIHVKSNNNVIRNNTILNNNDGIHVHSSSNNLLINNNASSNKNAGIYIFYSTSNNVTDNNVNSNYFGIILSSSNNNTITNNSASMNTDGIYLGISINNTLTNNSVSLNMRGLHIHTSSGRIYNNRFENINNVNFIEASYNILWNTSKILAMNIVGGPYLGGNFWAHSNGTGFSQTCTDADGDGICDSPYTLDGNNIDFLPLARGSQTHGTIILDGNLSDWSGTLPLITDQKGDVLSTGSDIKAIYGKNEGNYLYLAIDLNNPPASDGYIIDLDTTGGSGNEFFVESSGTMAKLFHVDWSAQYPNGYNTTEVDSVDMGVGDGIEYRIPLSLLGNYSKLRVSSAFSQSAGFFAHADDVIFQTNQGFIFANISIDGNGSEWSDISPAVTDPEGDSIGGAGTDIKSLYILRDNKYLYLRMDMWDGRTNTSLSGDSGYTFSIDDLSSDFKLNGRSVQEYELRVFAYDQNHNGIRDNRDIFIVERNLSSGAPEHGYFVRIDDLYPDVVGFAGDVVEARIPLSMFSNSPLQINGDVFLTDGRAFDITNPFIYIIGPPTDGNIYVDGNPSDWLGMHPILSDRTGDTTYTNSDVTALYSKIIGSDVYLMLETSSKPIYKNSTFELNLDTKPGAQFTHGTDDDFHLNVHGSGDIYAWVDKNLDGNMETFNLTSNDYKVVWGDVLEIKISLKALENATYVNPTFGNLWNDLGGNWSWKDIIENEPLAIVRIANVTATQNSNVTRQIMVENVVNLAAATIELTYNPNVVNVLSVSAGDLGAVTTNINNTIGKTIMPVFSTTPRSGNVTFANIILKAVGAINATTPLTLSVLTLADQNGAAIPYTIRRGTFTISSVINGDVNGDGQVTIVDALFVAQYTVGMKTLSASQLAAADVNGDGQVTIVDALFIAQYTVGLRQI